MKKPIQRCATILSLSCVICACSSQRPMLSSNDQLTRVGPEVAEREIDACMARADAVTKERQDPNSNVVASTATSGVVGAAAGGAGGAIFGHAGQGAAAGAVGGTVGSLTSALIGWMFRPKPPGPSKEQVVDNCLREKGYEPSGWK